MGRTKASDKGKAVATSSSKSTKRKAPEKSTPKPATPTQEALFNKFVGMKFDQTKFVDYGLLEKIGINEDVVLLFENMGVRKFMDMRETAQQELTCAFLSTLTARAYDPEVERDQVGFEKYGRGYIGFGIRDKSFKVTFAELCEIFGFPEDSPSYECSFRYPFGEHKRLWDTIGSGNYEPGCTKLALMRNPALRYAYKALMHVFYAKVEVDTVTNEGLEFLGTGLKPIMPRLADGGEYHGAERVPCLAALLANHLLEYKEWAWSTKAKRAFIGCGWIVTAILRAKAKQVHLNPQDLPFMDEVYLKKARFIKRRGEEFVYTFHPHTTATAKILLPQPQLTRLDSLANIIFYPPQEFFVDHIREDSPEHVYGASRYDFEPYTGPMNTTVATAQINERVNILYRKTKWQDRVIEKMAKTMRSMKKTIRELRCKLGEASEPTRMETSGEESSHRARRKGKSKRHAPTPSPPSSNESINLETDSSASPSPPHSN